MSEKTYVFKLEILGEGDDPDEAWRDAVGALANDPGITPDEWREISECICDSCGSTFGSASELKISYPNIPDLLIRIEPGGVVPVGECPHCHALVYQKAAPKTATLMISGGVIEALQVPDGVMVVVRDYDVEGTEIDDLKSDNDGALYNKIEFD